MMRVCRIPDYDLAGGEAALAAMEDFLETRGHGRAREYRRRAEPPEPMGPAEILQAETGRRAEVERVRFEREEQARIAASAERDAIYLANNRQVHRELADEYTVPRIKALEEKLAQLEGQLAQRGGELEAVDATPTPTATASEAPAESRRAKARRFLFGDMTQAEVERLLEEEGDGDE